VEVQLADGRKDLLITTDVENPLGLTPSWKDTAIMIQKETGIRFKGEVCWVRWDNEERIERVVICRGRSILVVTVNIELKVKTDFVEIRFDDDRAEVAAGPQENIEFIKIDNRSILSR
jgi:hypothetical protein